MPASRATVGIGDCFPAYPYPIVLTLLSTLISSTAYLASAAMIVASWSPVACPASPVCSLCNKKITGEQTVKMLVEQWFEPYGAPNQVNSDEDVRIHSDTGSYKRVLNALNVEVIIGVPYTHTSNPLCE